MGRQDKRREKDDGNSKSRQKASSSWSAQKTHGAYADDDCVCIPPKLSVSDEFVFLDIIQMYQCEAWFYTGQLPRASFTFDYTYVYFFCCPG